MIGDHRTEDLAGFFGGSLRLERIADLEHCIDREALLRDESAPEPPYWAHLWPAAQALGHLLSEEGSRLNGRRVVELGCGLGLPGLVAARCGAAVVMTDRSADALDFTRRNLGGNGLTALVLAMDWRFPAIRRQFDLCLAADVTYDPAANIALCEFLDRHLTPDGEVWIAESVRAEEPQLRDLLTRTFAVRESRVSEMEDGRPVWVRVLQGRKR